MAESTASSSNKEKVRVVHFTKDELLSHGLSFVGYPPERQARASSSLNNERFKHIYGSLPEVYVAMLVDLQKINDKEHRLVIRANPKGQMEDMNVTMKIQCSGDIDWTQTVPSLKFVKKQISHA